MPINVAHNVDPGLLGAVALLTGQGRNQQALAAQAADEAFRQTQLAEQVRRSQSQEQLAAAQLAQQGQQFDSRMQAGDRDRAAQLYQGNQRFNLAAFQQQSERGMLNDRLGANLLERQMMGQQERASAADRFGQQLHLTQLKERYSARAGEEERILSALPHLDQQEQEDLIGQFNERWNGLGLPGFQEIQHEMEQAPLEEDPAAFAAQMNAMLRENGFSPSAYVNPKDGSVDTMFGPDKDPAYLKQVLANKLQLEQVKQAAKVEQQKQQTLQRQQQLKDTFQQKLTTSQVDAELKSGLDRAGKQPQWKDYQYDEVTENPTTGAQVRNKKTDEDAYYNDLAMWKQEVADIYSAHTRRLGELGGAAPQAPQGQPIRVNSRAELEALPSGTPVILPDGTQSVRK